jgi:hypothetical protein
LLKECAAAANPCTVYDFGRETPQVWLSERTPRPPGASGFFILSQSGGGRSGRANGGSVLTCGIKRRNGSSLESFRRHGISAPQQTRFHQTPLLALQLIF